MSEPARREVMVNGAPCRVWENGRGEPIGFLAGLGGLMQWTPFLDRLAEHRRVVVPSLPGFPGGGGHERLDTQLDWILATRDLLEAAGLDGADLIGVSVGGTLAAEVAACWPGAVRRLVLVAPLGIFDPADPVVDVFAQRPGTLPGLLCADPARFEAVAGAGAYEDAVEGPIIATRASEAAARLLWPVLDTRLARRLPRIRQPTWLVWGTEDRVVPFSYAERFAALIGGPTRMERIEDAGHLVDLDQPDRLAATVRAALG